MGRLRAPRLYPLLDAIGRLLETLDQRIADPAHVDEDQIICIITDGAENASTDFTPGQITELIEARTKAGFTFMFLGANQTASPPARHSVCNEATPATSRHLGPGARRGSRRQATWQEAVRREARPATRQEVLPAITANRSRISVDATDRSPKTE